MTHVLALPAGTELVGDYRIERVLGAGGFGITYLAQELSLARDVTIKEYFPGDFAARKGSRKAVPRSQDCAGDYEWGLERFIAEAQILARFDHPNIVRVFRYFRANNTGYMVLQFEEGQSLKSWLQKLGRAPRQHELDKILTPILAALEVIHEANYLHRDIAPDNIIIRRDGSPVLIDFGSARGDIARQSRTVSALVKPGYSPYEQYAETGSQQGPWTDIYALAATLYQAVTGKRPPDAPSRIVKDELAPAREAAISSYRSSFLAAIDAALALDIDKRPQSIAEWRGPLLAPEPRKTRWLQRSKAKAEETKESEEPAKPAEVGPQAEAAPPEDAPRARGGLLEYIERLKRKSVSKGETAPQAAAEVAAPQPSEAPPSDRDDKKAPNTPSRVDTPHAPGVREGFLLSIQQARRKLSEGLSIFRFDFRGALRRSWKSLVFKLAVGVGVATLAVGLQEELSSFPAPDQSVVETETVLPRQLPGHTGGTKAVAFTEDGRWIVTAGADQTLRIWDNATGDLLRTIELGGSPVTALAVRGQRALTGHLDGTLQLWSLTEGEKIAQLQRNRASVWSVAFMGEPDKFLASSHDWAVSVWDIRAGQSPVISIDAHENAVQAVAYSPRGVLASGGADRLVKLWDASTGELLRTYRGHRDFVSAVAFSPDGTLLASASHDGQIRLWLTSSHRLYRTLSRGGEKIDALAFSPAGNLLAAASPEGRVRVWQFRRGQLVRSLGDGIAGFRSVAFSPDGRWLAAASDSGAVRLWSMGKLLQDD